MRSRLRASTPSRVRGLAVAMLLGACKSQPLPADKLDYAGHWRGPGVDLVIGLDGRVAYERGSGSGRVQIQGPIQGFVGDDFIVGVMVVKTTFDVTAPPTEKNGTFTMSVDGVELTRGQSRASAGGMGGSGGLSPTEGRDGPSLPIAW